MAHARIFVRYGGVWDERQRKYEGGILKGIVVSKEITHKDLLVELYALAEVNPIEFDIKIRCIYEIKVENEAPPLELTDDRDLKFYILSENLLEVPLYISFEPRSNQVVSKKVFNLCYNSISGSNQVHNLNVPVALDALDENEVEVGLCDNMIGATTRESHNSKDDTFVWDPVEMSSEWSDILQQRSISKEDCRKGRVKYGSTSRKLNAKKYIWSEESSTSEELEVGQIFFHKRELSTRLSLLAIKKNFQFLVKKSTKGVLYVKCIDEKCKWRLRAIKLKGSNIFKISKYVNIHSCSLNILNRDHRQAKSWVVGELIKSKFKGTGLQYKPLDIIEDMRQDYGINMSYEKAWRARENAYERVCGSPEESYKLLCRFGEALKLANPNTIYHIELEDEYFFKYLFMALGPCVRGFLNCIRPVIVMDSTSLKNKTWGQLIVATCLDGNNQVYPLAFGIVDRETDVSINWFLEKLKGAIGEVQNLGFVTEQNSSFSKCISSVFPSAFHGLCVQHLTQNLNDKFNNETTPHLFNNASRAYRESKFEEAWRSILAFDNGVGRYLDEVGISRWSRMHCPGRRYSMMTTNIAKSMNAILKELIELPITSFLEHVRALLQTWFWERREEGTKVTSTLTKWAESIVQKRQEQSLTMKVDPIDCYQFHVKDLDNKEVVNLHTRECTCKVFQAEQLPCPHAIAAARDQNINVYSLCDNYYTIECLLAAYGEVIFPVGNASEWKTSDNYVARNVLPPKVVKRVSRPKNKRIPFVGEAPNMHNCGRCKQKGHNRLTCTNPIACTEKSSVQS